jgi:hypothetical protein
LCRKNNSASWRVVGYPPHLGLFPHMLESALKLAKLGRYYFLQILSNVFMVERAVSLSILHINVNKTDLAILNTTDP